MKKLLKLLLGFVIFCVVCVAAVGATAYFTLLNYEDIRNQEVIDANLTTKEVLNTSLQKSTNNVMETQEIQYLMDEKDLEYLLHSILSSIELSYKDFEVIATDIDVKEGAYYLKASCKYKKLQTMLTCGLKFNEVDHNFIIELKDLKIGRINLVNISKKIINKIDLSKFTQSLEQYKIFCDVDFNNFTITFTLDDIYNMINANCEDEAYSLIQTMVGLFYKSNELLTFSLGKNDLVGATLHMQTLHYDETIKGALPYHYDFATLRNNTKSMLDNNKIDRYDTNVLFQFLLKGYADLSDNEKEIIRDVDCSSIGINNNQLYTGIFNKTGESLEHSFTSQLETTPATLVDGKVNLAITDDTICEVLKNFDFIGYTYAYANALTNDVGYMCFEQFDTIFKENEMYLELIANINGYQIYVEVKTHCEEQTGLKILGQIENVSFGTNALSNENTSAVLGYLQTIFSSGELNWITVDSPNRTIELDFTTLITRSSDLTALIEAIPGISAHTSIKDGYLEIEYR